MTDEDTCPACREGAADRYEAQDGLFSIWCAFRGHSTERYADMSLARLEWLGSRRGVVGEADERSGCQHHAGS